MFNITLTFSLTGDPDAPTRGGFTERDLRAMNADDARRIREHEAFDVRGAQTIGDWTRGEDWETGYLMARQYEDVYKEPSREPVVPQPQRGTWGPWRRWAQTYRRGLWTTACGPQPATVKVGRYASERIATMQASRRYMPPVDARNRWTGHHASDCLCRACDRF